MVKVTMDVPDDMSVRALQQVLTDAGASNVQIGSGESKSDKGGAVARTRGCAMLMGHAPAPKSVKQTLIDAGVPAAELDKVDAGQITDLHCKNTKPLGVALRRAFGWSRSPQGFTFWYIVTESLETHGKLYQHRLDDANEVRKDA